MTRAVSTVRQPPLRSTTKPIAVIYTEVYMIAPEEVLALARKYPKTHKLLRKRIVWLALRREVIRLASHVRAAYP